MLGCEHDLFLINAKSGSVYDFEYNYGKAELLMKYFLKANHQKAFDEVTKDQYIEAEGAAGFYSESGENETATSSFDGHGVEGMTEEE